MSYLAVIVGISGSERYLAGHQETPEAKRAQRFRSERAAREAAQAHVGAFPAVIQRSMSFRVEEFRTKGPREGDASPRACAVEATPAPLPAQQPRGEGREGGGRHPLPATIPGGAQ